MKKCSHLTHNIVNGSQTYTDLAKQVHDIRHCPLFSVRFIVGPLEYISISRYLPLSSPHSSRFSYFLSDCTILFQVRPIDAHSEKLITEFILTDAMSKVEECAKRCYMVCN